MSYNKRLDQKLERHLDAVAAELQAAHARLQAERAQLLQQQHFMTCLAEALGHYRSSLCDEDDGSTDMGTALLEDILLEQLTVIELPALVLRTGGHDSSSSSLADAAVSSCSLDAPPSSCQGSHTLKQPSSRTGGTAPQTSSDGLCCCLQQDMQMDNEPVSPDSDPFLLLQVIYNQPFDPRARDITLPELRAMWREDVEELAACLIRLEAQRKPGNPADVAAPAESCNALAGAVAGADDGLACSDCCGSSSSSSKSGNGSGTSVAATLFEADPLEQIKEIQMRMLTFCMSMITAERCNLFFQLQLSDWITGESRQEPCMRLHRAAVEALQLSPAQQRRLITGHEFFQRLFTPILLERKQLHQQGVHLPGAAAPPQPASPNPAPAKAAAEGQVVSAVTSHQGAQLQLQREQAERLRLLGGKDTMLRGAMAAYLQGCLSWVQQAKLRVCMAPYHVSPGIFFVALMEHMQQQEQQ